jgi:hypothetical protein
MENSDADHVQMEPPPDEASAPKAPLIGFLKGHIRIPRDFDRMGEEEIAAMFDGAEIKDTETATSA